MPGALITNRTKTTANIITIMLKSSIKHRRNTKLRLLNYETTRSKLEIKDGRNQ